MSAAPSRLRRAVLRGIVLTQFVVLALVAHTLWELVAYGREVTPTAVGLVALMLACTAVAMRATFRRTTELRGHRIVFMSAQAIASLAPLAARTTLFTIVAAGSAMPADGLPPGFVVDTIALALLLASVLAAVSALLAPLLLPPPAGSTATMPFARALGVWVAGAAVVAAMATSLYAAHFEEMQSAVARVHQLFGSEEAEVRWAAAQRLVSTDLASRPEARQALFDGLERPSSLDQARAAYVLIASGADDGRAMQHLRNELRSFGAGPAARSLAVLGAAAAPAVTELTDLVGRPSSDDIDVAIRRDATEALAAIGPPAIGSLPALLEHVRNPAQSELRAAAARAIDRIDPGYAARCAVGAATMVGALAMEKITPLKIRPECEPKTET
ncbi:MAG: hypothetical protein ABR587_16400 [Candidatus Binatia bacterium]